jgi:hypothetical protein
MIKQSAQSENLSLKPEVDALLVELGVDPHQLHRWHAGGEDPRSPARPWRMSERSMLPAPNSAIEKAHAAFLEWRLIPAPKRGELVRLLGEELRANDCSNKVDQRIRGLDRTPARSRQAGTSNKTGRTEASRLLPPFSPRRKRKGPELRPGPFLALQGYIRPTQQKPSCSHPCEAPRC